MADEKKKHTPEEGPNGVDRWTSNGYGLCIDGIEVTPPAESDIQYSSQKEVKHGNKTPKSSPHER